MSSTEPLLEKPRFPKHYGDLTTALVSAFGLGIVSIKAIDCYRHIGVRISPELIVISGLVLLALLVTSLRSLLSYLKAHELQK
jgi:hypothetical protein